MQDACQGHCEERFEALAGVAMARVVSPGRLLVSQGRLVAASCGGQSLICGVGEAVRGGRFPAIIPGSVPYHIDVAAGAGHSSGTDSSTSRGVTTAVESWDRCGIQG